MAQKSVLSNAMTLKYVMQKCVTLAGREKKASPGPSPGLDLRTAGAFRPAQSTGIRIE